VAITAVGLCAGLAVIAGMLLPYGFDLFTRWFLRHVFLPSELEGLYPARRCSWQMLRLASNLRPVTRPGRAAAPLIDSTAKDFVTQSENSITIPLRAADAPGPDAV
jgi:hypothetical protein